GTLWRGKAEFPTPMLFALGGIVVFLFGGLTGPPNGTVATDLHLHDTYWIVGHFHNTMFGGFIYPFFAAIYYWYPKITGRRMDEKLGKLHFWMMTPAFWVVTFGMMWIGLLGMRRRIADYDPTQGFDTAHLVITIAAFFIATAVLIFVINLIFSLKDGEVATENVWRSRSPEWQVASPMPEHNYERPFKVVGEPYDYGLPGSVYVDMNPALAGD
ncbi:MAG: cbb3-type cytochrome c oxidase subunit I, partial [Chloroflexota bacterium]